MISFIAVLKGLMKIKFTNLKNSLQEVNSRYHSYSIRINSPEFGTSDANKGCPDNEIFYVNFLR